MVNYLLNHRLLWGKPDTLARLPTRRVIQPDELAKQDAVEDQSSSLPKNRQGVLPPIPENSPKYFTAETPPELVSIIMNDWPYSVPPEIEHVLIWIRLPLIPDDLPASIAPRIAQDGLWGFTGNDSPPPSPSLLPLYLPALSDWGVTMEKLVRSPRGTDEEEELVKQAGSQIDTYVRRHWPEDQWETAWFSNPPRLQSVPGLAHIHVFARYKGN
ncbi:hypothetical protein K474DRAFT_1656442 [Panus rudis PR-1116 ss-1]|nr:hypothetical protein K474DRAFT_1656442 [Panus rudis PR-1116 ss-1]